MKRVTCSEIRRSYTPRIPEILSGPTNIDYGKELAPADAGIDEIFPKCKDNRIAHIAKAHKARATLDRVGLLFSGGQAPGGHNVISGIFDSLQAINPQATLYGYLNGAKGLITHDYRILAAEDIAAVRNAGGFDLIGSGRTKIASPEQFAASYQSCKDLALDALIIIGGDDSNTNAALLAEYFLSKGLKTCVIGVPKTIDGDLKTEWIEASFGFDTASKIYSELIGNIARDASSARKYWHFIKVMGRSASHIALECALRVHPNICIISEEVAEKNLTLREIVQSISSSVLQRAEDGNSFGIVILPEGLIEFIPEIGTLISELNTLLAKNVDPVETHLSDDARTLFLSLPKEMQAQLLMERDPHGNVQVSRIETEKLIADMVEKEVQGNAGSISTMAHFFGYEGRAGFPSNFDADYCYALGATAAALAQGGLNGYIAALRNLAEDPREWQPAGIPLRTMIHLEERGGVKKPVIKKALVELEGAPFRYFAAHRDKWARTSSYQYPGPIQFFGPPELSNARSLSLLLDAGKKV